MAVFRNASAFFLKQGGKMGEDDVSEMDRKKMEVRARLEQQSQAKKKKGFMTPERKKKLRVKNVFASYSLFSVLRLAHSKYPFEVEHSLNFSFKSHTVAAAEEEGRRGAQEGTGAQGGREEKGHRREVRQAQECGRHWRQ